MFRINLRPLYLAGLTLSLIACGGTEEESAGQTGNIGAGDTATGSTGNEEQFIQGVAIDGYLNNAEVCLDVNGDLACSEDDGAVVMTNSQGEYRLPLGNNSPEGRLLLVRAIAGQTIDMDRPDEPVSASFVYTSPARDNAVISPLSSIISALSAQRNISQEQAEQTVASAIGIDADMLNDDFVADESMESQQVHALAQALTKMLQELNSAAGINSDKSLFNRLLAQISLQNLKAITDKPLLTGTSDLNVQEQLRNEAREALNSFIADFIADSAQAGDITAIITNPEISEELQQAYDEFGQLVNTTNTDLARFPQLQQAYTNAVNEYSVLANEFVQCRLILCSELVVKQQQVIAALAAVRARISDIQSVFAGIRNNINLINQRYAPLVSDLTRAGDLEKVKELLNLRLGVLSAFNVHAGEEVAETPDTDADGVTDNRDAFPANRYETQDQNSNHIGDNAESVSDSFNAFSLDLFKYQSLRSGTQSMVLSPLSIAQALSMTLAGARQQTALELGDALYLNTDNALSDNERIGVFTSEDVLEKIGSMNNYREQKDSADTSVFKSANNVWFSHSLNVLPEYNRRLSDYFGVQAGTLNFSDADQVAREVNAWVASNTENEIDSILQPDDIDRFTRAILANAVYFKADWVNAFDSESTQNSAFFSQPSGFLQQVNLPVMNQVMSTQYYRGNIGNVAVKAVDLDYGTAETDSEAGYSRYSMTVILPDLSAGSSANNYQSAAQGALSVASLQEVLTWPNLKPFLKQLDEASVLRPTQVRLPRFRVESETDVIDVLKILGVREAFENTADFGGISDEALRIDKIKHKATIEVEEQGTVAAAATAVILSGRSLTVPNDFNANRPFIYLIRDNKLNSILFIGRFSG